MDLSIIIISYNTKDLLKQCLDSIVSSLKSPSSPISYEIIVVDNHSLDGSREYLKKLLTKKPKSLSLKVIFNDKNLGFAKANNQAIKIAKGKYVLFLNPDTVVLPKTIATVLDFLKNHPRVGVATCRVELPNGRLDDGSHRGFPTPWNAFCHFSGLEKIFPKSKIFAGYSLGHRLSLKKPHEIDACVGAFMMVPRKVGDEVGWWDEDFFWYGEDLDFCYRVKERGYRVFFLPKVKIIHYKGSSSGIKKTKSKAKKETRLKAALASTQAMRIFYQKHYLNKYSPLVKKIVFWGISLLEKLRIWQVKRKFK